VEAEAGADADADADQDRQERWRSEHAERDTDRKGTLGLSFARQRGSPARSPSAGLRSFRQGSGSLGEEI
jgi:hypothetical protein